MADAPLLQKLFMKKSEVTIGGIDWRKQVANVTLTPASSTLTWAGLDPDAVYSDAAAATWTLAMTLAQDWDLEQSLCRYLFEHEGETVLMTFAPIYGGTAFDCDVTITPGAIGGAVNTAGEAQVTLGVVGRPVPTYAAPVAP